MLTPGSYATTGQNCSVGATAVTAEFQSDAIAPQDLVCMKEKEEREETLEERKTAAETLVFKSFLQRQLEQNDRTLYNRLRKAPLAVRNFLVSWFPLLDEFLMEEKRRRRERARLRISGRSGGSDQPLYAFILEQLLGGH